jgi:hypothetical protein
MFKPRVGLACLGLWMLSGCASTFTAVADRPVTSDKYVYAKDSNKTQKISGDRRFARIYQDLEFETDGEGDLVRDENGNPIKASPWYICIEPHADAISTKGAASSIAITDNGTAADAATSVLLQTFQRTQAADIVRRLPYVACEAFLNSPMRYNDHKRYQARIDRIIEGSLAFLAAQNVQGPASVPAATATAAPTAPMPSAAPKM